MPDVRRLLAEFVGTFVLVFAGTGAIVVDDISGGDLGLLGVSVVFGLAIGAGVFALRHVSGAHFNPAISAAMATIGRFPVRGVLPYWGAQIAGAVGGSLVVRALYGNVAGLGATSADIALWKAFSIEVALTAILAFVIARVATSAEHSAIGAAAAIGGAVFLGALLGGPVTGGSMNPARSLGPALVGWHFDDLWLYLLAPLAGACAGALLYVAAGRLAIFPVEH